MNNSSNFKNGIKLNPSTLTPSTQGDIVSDSVSGDLKYHNGTSSRQIQTDTNTAILTNKTLTGNTAVNLISGSGTLTLNTTGTITVPNATDTLVGKATIDIFTNKSISGSTNTLTNIPDSAISTSAKLYNRINDYISVKDYGAVGDGITDDTSSIQNAIIAAYSLYNRTVFFPTGIYKITDTITIGRGIDLLGAGSQGSNQAFGVSFIHYSVNDLFKWDGSDLTFKGSGGGLKNALILKATGYSGGNAVKLESTDNTHWPTEMQFDNILIYALGSGQWDRGLYVDGSNNNVSGAVGMRDLYFNKFRIAGCSTNNEYARLRQVGHFYGNIQTDTGTGTGTNGITLDGNWFDVHLWGLRTGNLIMTHDGLSGVNHPNIIVDGQVSSINNNYVDVKGFARLTTDPGNSGITSITNNAIKFHIYTTDGAITGALSAGTSITAGTTLAAGTTLSSGTTTSVGTRLGIGGGTASAAGVYLSGSVTSGTTQYGYDANLTFSSSVTANAYTFASLPLLAASATLTNEYGYLSNNLSLGAGATVTNQYGFATSDLTSGTNNYGFYSNVSSGSGKFSFYGNGTAANYFGGSTTQNGALICNSTLAATGVSSFNGISNVITSSANNISINSTHGTILLTASGKTATLPTAVGISGRQYTIKLTAAGTGTVATTSSQTIDGSTTYNLSSQYFYVTVQSDGANWNIISSIAATLALDSGTYSPTVTNVSGVTAITSYTSNYMRVGSVVTVSGRCDLTFNSTANPIISITLPVTSNFTAREDGTGTAGEVLAGSGQGNMVLYANASSSLMYLQWTSAASGGPAGFYYHFTYLIK